MKNIFTIKKFLLTVLLVTLVYADLTLAITEQTAPSLGEIVGNLHGGAGFLSRIMWGVCAIIGIILCCASIIQFQTHRQNPKFVPLTMPITYLLLGLVALAIPVIEKIFDFEKANEATKVTDTTNSVQHQPIPLPDYIDIDK